MNTAVSFFDRYMKGAMKMLSFLCVGLDPTPDHVPAVFGSGLFGMENYLREVIDIAAEKVPVVKPQYAYYGAMGPDGIRMLMRLIAYAHHKGLLALLDAKRGDIGPTMAMYGVEVFDQYDADACTVVPYLGSTFLPSKGTDSWMPWLAKGKAVIPMIRTSNGEAVQFQDLALASGLKVYEQAAIYAKDWQAYVAQETGANSVGGVVGATYPAEAPRCRELAGDHVPFLIPGYGPGQGGDADGAVSGILTTDDTLSGLVNNSRGITLYSWRDKATKEPKAGDPMELVAKAIDDSNADLNAALERRLGCDFSTAIRRWKSAA